MAKHLVHHSHKEKQKLCTRQNNTLENPRNTYLCNGYMKKTQANESNGCFGDHRQANSVYSTKAQH